MKIKRIVIDICDACLEGNGQMCNTPGCALFGHKVDLPIDEGMYHTVFEYDDSTPELIPAETALRKAVENIVRNMNDRRGMHIDHIDEDIQKEIKESFYQNIRDAFADK